MLFDHQADLFAGTTHAPPPPTPPLSSAEIAALHNPLPPLEGEQLAAMDAIQAFLASQSYNFPCFTNQVPDIADLLKHDTKGKPADKYAVLTDALSWATNVGYPGYANAAVDEAYSTWVLNTMFARSATGAISPEDAVREAAGKYQAIWAKWKERRLI